MGGVQPQPRVWAVRLTAIISTLSVYHVYNIVKLCYNRSAFCCFPVSLFWGGVVVPSLAAVSASVVGPVMGAFVVRRSVRSLSGWVVALVFPSHAAACAFAIAWAVRLPVVCRGCAVRAVRAPSGRGWSVSVPVLVV